VIGIPSLSDAVKESGHFSSINLCTKERGRTNRNASAIDERERKKERKKEEFTLCARIIFVSSFAERARKEKEKKKKRREKKRTNGRTLCLLLKTESILGRRQLKIACARASGTLPLFDQGVRLRKP
jgi:hypothetical protein